MARRINQFVTSRGHQRKADTTIDKLKLTRKQVQAQFRRRSDEAAASRRYIADEKFKGDLPISQVQDKKPLVTAAKKEEPKKETKAPQVQADHIQRLLKAKRKSGEHKKENE